MNSNQAPSFTISMNDPNSGSQSSNFNEKSNGGSSGDSNKSLEYILHRNETLDNENRSLREQISELQNRLDEEETNNDKNDSRMVHMKGMTKNVVEAKNLCEKIKSNSVKVHDIYKNMNIETEKFSMEFSKICLINISIVFSVIFMFSLFHSYWLLFTFSSMITGNYYIYLNHYVKIYDTYNNKIQKMKEDINGYQNIIKAFEMELKELKNATDFLNDHIDSI